jgi:hypothetical protein
MYINNDDFETWMQKLSRKLTEIGKDLKSLINTSDVFEGDEKILDNQDLAFLLKVSYRTLQRYRSNKILPYFTIGHKTYYRVNDVRTFVREHMDAGTYQEFEKKHPKGSKDKDNNTDKT